MSRSFLSLAIALGLPSLAVADQILVLSGGAAPVANHYSQYLQTKTLADSLRSQTPGTPLTVYFGAGNATNSTPVLADVHKSVKDSFGWDVESQVAGAIAGNRPATQAEVAAYFSQPQLGQMKSSETLFLFVSDHGMPQTLPDGSLDSTFGDNCIDLWAFNANLATGQYQMGSAQDRCFSQKMLKSNLDRKVSAGRVVYAMSQCYSGGFHKMAVGSSNGYPSAPNARVCGFTAVTEDTTASGCTPNVDGPGYQGYERSFTEHLTGFDVVSGKKLRQPKTSILSAHRAAALEDMAKDIPLGTSDFYLWKWALAIEAGASPRQGSLNSNQVQAILAATTLKSKALTDADYKSKQAFVSQMTQVLSKAYPQISSSLQGSIADLKDLEARYSSDLQLQEIELNRLAESLYRARTALLQRWNWFARSGGSTLSAADLALEKDFFGAMDTRAGLGAADQTALFNLSILTLTQPQDAKTLVAYKANRERFALEWASSSNDGKLNSLAQNILNMKSQMARGEDTYVKTQSAEGHARRLLIYRQTLGAWEALAAVGDSKAINEAKALIACESASLK